MLLGKAYPSLRSGLQTHTEGDSMRLLSLMLFSVVSIPALAQSNASEVQALQSLVNEVHQLREELRTVTVASQRVQIVLYRLQAQEGAVNRATQRLSDQRATLINAQERLRDVKNQIQMLEDQQSRTQNPSERKEIDSALPQLRSRLESLTKDEQQFEANVNEADSQLRREQQELTRLQGFLDQLDSVLNGIAQSPK
jgi:chromosome segregation ATPase